MSTVLKITHQPKKNYRRSFISNIWIQRYIIATIRQNTRSFNSVKKILGKALPIRERANSLIKPLHIFMS